MTSIRSLISSRGLAAILFAMSVGMICSSAHAVTRTWDGGGTPNTNMDVAANWTADTVPNASTPDTAQWDGTVAGALNLTYTAAGTGVNLSTGAGNFINVTANQTSPLTINQASGTNGLRIQNITIAPGAGAFTIGTDTAFNDIVTLGAASVDLFTFTNNSANTATIGNDVRFAYGGGDTDNIVTLTGSGNWSFGGKFGNNGTGALQSFVKNGAGTATITNNLNGTNSSGNPGPSNVFVKNGTMVFGTGAALTTVNFNSVGQDGTDNGTLTLQSNGTFTSGNDFNVADIGSSQGTLNVSDTAALTINTGGGFFVASANAAGSTASGIVNHSGGTITANRTNDGAFIIGGRASGATGTGTYNLSGTGTLTNAGNAWIGGFGSGTVNQTGGTWNNTGFVSIARQAGSTGVYNISDGALNQTGASTEIIVAEVGTGTLNISNTAQVTSNTAVRIGNNASANGTVNLNGGTLTTPTVKTVAGTSTFNFNGGTLKASTNSATFMNSLTRANIRNGGAVIDSNGFNLTMAQPLLHSNIGGDAAIDGGLTKNGSGNLTMSGASTFTGPTNVNSGTLTFDTSQSSVGATTVADLAVLGAKHTTGSVPTLTSTSLTLGASSLNFDFNNLTNPTAALISTGPLTVNNNQNVNFFNTAGLVTGTYPLISYSSFAGSGVFPGGTFNFTPRTTGTIVNNGVNAVNLNVVADKPVWTGKDGSDWKVGTTGANSNWKLQSGGTPTDYIEGDSVVFDDSATGTTSVNISAADVLPSSVVFNNATKTYTLTAGFGISGSGNLIKNGAGTTNLETSSSYTGGTTLNAGTLNLNAGNAVGSNSPTTVTGGTLGINNVSGLGSGTLTITGGKLDNTSGFAVPVVTANAQNWNGDFEFVGSNDLDMGTGAVTLGGSGSSRTVTVDNGTFTVGTIAGPSQGLTKTGPGKLAINPLTVVQNNVIAGTLNVAAGTLQINTGSVAATTMDFIANGLTGSGTIQNGGGMERWLYITVAGSDTFSGTLENGGPTGLGLNKLGVGTLTLSGTSTYTGTTTLTQGTLVAASPTALGNTFRLNVPANSNGTFRYATDGAVADNTVPIGMGTGVTSVLNVVSDRATPGAAVDRTMSVAAANGMGGGTVNFTSGANVTSGTPKITFTQFGLGAGSNQTTILNPVGVNLSLGDTSKFNNNVSQTLELGGTSTLNEVTGVISNGAATGANTVSISKTNTGTWTLSGANTYTGTTTLTDGTLIVTNTAALSGTARLNVTNTTGTGPLFVYSTDGGDTTVPIGLSTGSTFTVVSGRATPGPAVIRTMTVPGTIGGLGNGTINFTPGANINSGTPRIEFNEFALGAGSGGTTLVNPTGVVLSLGNVTKVINTPNQTLGLGGTSSGNEVTGVISNGLATAVSVTKSNTSTWTLTGNSTYSGTTAVNGGTLLVTGNNSGATGAVNIAAAGTLGGTGTLGGLVTNNGTIAPGTTGIGTLNVASLTLSAGSTLSLDLGAPSTGDLINITATNGLTLSGGGVVVNNAGGLGVGTYPILDYAGTLGGALANLGTPTGPGGFSYSLQDDNTNTVINLVVAAAANNGDWNGDTKVNAADYVTWRKNPSANGNDPGGYVTWRENFGTTSGSGSGLSGAAVPEPATFALVGLAVGMMLFSRRGR